MIGEVLSGWTNAAQCATPALKAVARFVRNRTAMARTSASQQDIIGWG